MKAFIRMRFIFPEIGILIWFCIVVLQSNGVVEAACPDLTAPENGSVNVAGVNKDDFASYTCSDGFSLNGTNFRICQADNSWSDSAPNCVIKDCGTPKDPAGGTAFYTTTTYSSVLTYTCNTGYTITAGSSSANCTTDGWSDRPPTCTIDDTDECTAGTDNCDTNAACTNTAGSFTCACNTGYNGDGTSCTDINECTAGTDNCDTNATCTNTAGSFTCACNTGYKGDGTSCTDINECTAGTDNCDTNAACTNTVGSFTCACNTGYNGDGTSCTDTDECTAGTDNCDTNAACTNTAGSFTCACNTGYKGDGTTCTDINECTAGTDNCDTNAACTNTAGSFTCACNTGYNGDGTSCTDIDECASNPCENGGTCTNDQNRFTCTCAAGWTGVNCNVVRKEHLPIGDLPDIDECAARIDNCSSNARCDNTAGSFTCTCDWGYKGNGYSCVSQLEYLCNPDDSIYVFNLPDDSYLFAMQVVTNGNDILCTVHEENATTVNLTGCSKNEEIIITYGPYSEIATYKLHGGKTVIVKFVCLEIAEQGVIHTVNSSYAAQLTIDQQISIDPSYSLTSQLSATSTTVGSEIIWTILFPENYNLEVSSCTAYPGIDDSSENYVNLISNGGCSVIADIISNFNSYSNGTATATFQAFKFYNYESVFMECSVKICPSGTACMTSCSRQKRGIQKRASGRQRSMIPATISNVLYVADGQSSGTLQCILDFPMTVILTVIIAITKAARG